MKIIFTTGDLNGIGIEVLLKSLSTNIHLFQKHHFAIATNTEVIQYVIDCYHFEQ